MKPDQPSPPTPAEPIGEIGPGQRLGKYKIARKLGAGGMGTVFLAEDVELKRTVALKVLPRDRAENPTLVRRFKAEGQAAAHLQHKNIIQVYEAGEIEGFLYLALEYVDGIDLLAWIQKRGPVPVKRSIDIVRQTAEALQHAYEKNIVHRDIKPSNLMITLDGKVKLADMGLARSIDETLDTSITRDGTTVGTIDYMAPEQARNSKAADIRSDIYSLGCTWYHMLTGSPPFPDGSITNKVQAHMHAPRPNPQAFNPSVPGGIVAVLHRMMAIKQQDRYDSPADLIQELAADQLLRADVVTRDLLAALSQESRERQSDGSDQLLSDDEEEDWANMIRRVRESSSEGRQEFEYEETPGKVCDPEEVTREAGESKRGSPRHDPKKGGPKANKQAAQPATRPGRKGSPLIEQKKSQPENRDRRGKPMPARMPLGTTDSAQTAVSIDFIKIALLLVAVFGGSSLAWWGWKYYQARSVVQGGPVNPYDRAYVDGQAQSSRAPEGTSDQQPDKVNDASAPDQPATAASEASDNEDNAVGNNDSARTLPEWVKTGWGPPPGGSEPVRRIIQRGTEYPDLASGIDSLPSQGGILEFSGVGPYSMNAASLDRFQQLQLRGEPGGETIILVRDSNLTADHIWLSLASTRLLMENLHLIYIGTPEYAAVPASLLHVKSGEVTLRRCCVSSLGSSNPVRLGDVAGGSQPRMYIDECLISGGGLTVVESAIGGGEIVLDNCVVLNDQQSVFAIHAAASQHPTKLFISNSLLVSSRAILELDHPGKDIRSPVQVTCLQSRFIRGPVPGQAASVQLRDWPANSPEQIEQPLVRDVSFLTNGLSLVGWDVLTRQEQSSGIQTDITDPSSWRQFWRQSLTSESITPPVDFAALGLKSIHDASTAQVQNWLQADFSDFNSQVRWPSGEAAQRLQAIAGSSLDASSAWPASGEPIRFDLSKESVTNSLHALLNSSRCPDGARVVCHGAGIKSLFPVTISGKRVQIEFESTGTTPLDVRPAPDQTASALFTVNGGHLMLSNAAFSIPESRGRKFAPTLLRMNSGVATLIGCHLTGASDSLPARGIIEWEGTQQDSAIVHLDNCVLRGSGTLLTGSLAGDTLVLQNSLLVTGSDAIHLNGVQTAGKLHFQKCTLSAAQSILHVDAAETSGDWSIFSDETVFAPPTASTASTSGRSPSVLMMSDESLLSLKWWETGCAYANQLAMRTDLAGMVTAQTARDLWNPAHVSEALFGPDGVVLTGVLESESKASIEDFQLQTGCKAASWAADGGPIGFQQRKAPGPSAPGPARTPGTKAGDTGRPAKPGF